MKRYLRIIVMASGLSRRFGENKLLVDIDGKPMVHHVLENVSAFLRKHPDKGTGIVVSSYDEILDTGKRLGLRCVHNLHSEKGQAESIKLGLLLPLDAADEKREAAVFLTADQPWMEQETLERFLLETAETEAGFLCAINNNISGSPVSFDEKYYPELLKLQGDQGGKRIMNQYLEDVSYMEINKKELKDVDLPQDMG